MERMSEERVEHEMLAGGHVALIAWKTLPSLYGYCSIARCEYGVHSMGMSSYQYDPPPNVKSSSEETLYNGVDIQCWGRGSVPSTLNPKPRISTATP